MSEPSPAELGPLARRALASGWFDQIMRWRATDIIRKSELTQHLPTSGQLLDLGSGLGHLAEAILRGPNRTCVAADPVWRPQPKLVARLRRAGAGWLGAVQANGTKLPFANAQFDGVWCAFVLHHMSRANQALLLAEVARILRADGVFILIEDTPVSKATVSADRRLNFEDEMAEHFYRNPAEWEDLLRKADLNPESSIAFTGVFPRATLRHVPHRAFICRRMACCAQG